MTKARADIEKEGSTREYATLLNMHDEWAGSREQFVHTGISNTRVHYHVSFASWTNDIWRDKRDI